MRSRFGRKAAVVAVALALVAGACGSDGSDEAAEPAGSTRTDAAAPADGTAAAPDGDAAVAVPGEAPVDPAAAPDAADPAPGQAGGAPAAAPAGSAPAPRSARGDAPTGTPSGGGSAPGGAAPPGGSASAKEAAKADPARPPGSPAAPNTPAPAVHDTSPVTIGSVGTLSGPAGSIIKQTAEGVQVWAAWVNSRGGLSGREVKFIMADDGGDPARYKSELQRLIESDHVVALVGNPDALTGSAGVEYVTRKGVPYIGGDGGGDWFYQSPMYFPQGTVGYTLAEAEVRDAAIYAQQRGKKKFGTITCTEADFCRVADRIWNDQAASVGLDPVYRGKTSLVQPDFTAECLAAQRAGAEVLEVALDSNSIRRLASSCARQGYKPLLGWPAGIAKDDQKDEPSLEGARVTIFTFPWTQSDTPATAEFAEAVKKFGRQLAPFTAGHSGGWTAAKLFEKAVSLIPGKVTREAVLASLWTFKGETLGGLTSPLTFVKGEKAPRQRCWLTLVIQDKQFRLQRNGQYVCQ